MERVQHEEKATLKECNTKEVYIGKAKSATWSKHCDRVKFRKNCTRRMHKNMQTDNGPSVNGRL